MAATKHPKISWSPTQQLLMEGRYIEVCAAADAADAAILATPAPAAQSAARAHARALVLRQKVLAYWHLDMYDEAVVLCRQLVERRAPDRETDVYYLGASHWLTGNRTAAITAWRDGEWPPTLAQPSGIDYVMARWFAGVALDNPYLCQEAHELLHSRSLQLNREAVWGPLALYAQGTMSPTELFQRLDHFDSQPPAQRYLGRYYASLALSDLLGASDLRKLRTPGPELGAEGRLIPERYLSQHSLGT